MRPEWSPLPREGVVGVDGKVLGRAGSVFLALLRFGADSTIDEHSAPFEIDVFCLEGSGFDSIDGERRAVTAGDRLHWPAGKQHRLWTTDATMLTLMVEHHS
jgi:quercetin dioxygenase-like cupin family protein